MLKVFVCSCSEGIGNFIPSDFVSEGYACVQFSDGEFEVHYESSLRGDDVFLIQSLTTSDSIIELMMAINAAKLASAKTITAVIPYLGYARQDRKSCPRVSVGAKVILKTLESLGVDRIITMDLHAAQEVAFVDIPVDHLHSTAVFIPSLQVSENTVFVAPDAGASKLVTHYAKHFSKPMVLCHKVRTEVNKVNSMMVIGDVKGKDCIIIDDMCDTAGTLCRCTNELKVQGANSVTAVFTHSVLSGDAIRNICNSKLDKVVTTNTIISPALYKLARSINVVECDVTPLLIKAITSAYENKSIESLFIIKQ